MIQTIELKIDPEFRDKIPPLTDAEFEQLKENILADGEVYEPICVWDGTIVDGHNRWKIIQEHPTIPFRTKEVRFADKWEAFDWMYKKQLGRRNLTDEQRTVLIGKMYEARKKSHGNNAKRGDDGQYLSTQNGNTGEQPQRISDQIAQELGVSKNTVIRAEKFAKGIDKIKEVSPEAADKILAGNSGINKSDVMDLVKKNDEEVKAAVEEIRKPKAEKKSKDKVRSEIGEKIVANRELNKRIDEVAKLVSDTETKNIYTEADAEEEFENLMNEFVGKIRQVIQVRNDVVKGSKKLKFLLNQFSIELKNLKEEI